MKNKLRKFFSSENLISNIFIPSLILTGYFGIIGVFLNHYQLFGVTHIFVFKMIRSLIYVLFFEAVVLISILIINKKRIEPIKHKSIIFSFSDLILILFPLTPVAQYIIINSEILSLFEIIIILAFFIFLTGLLTFGVPRIFGIVGNIRVLIALGLALNFTIITMPSLSQIFNWNMEGNFFIQILFFLGTFIIIFILNVDRFKKLLYGFILVNFFVTVGFQLFSQNTETETRAPILKLEDNALFSAVDGKDPEIKPDVFLLIYESYVPNETLLAYEFNNQDQENFLLDKGFKIYPDIYSVGAFTIESISRLFNTSPDLYSDRRLGIAGDGVVQNLFKNMGYTTHGYVASTWIFRGYGSKYDLSYPNTKENNMDSDELLISAILVGEFRSDLFFEEPTYNDFIKEKHTLFENDLPDPGFYYVHSAFPGHSQDSGRCQSDEVEQYLKRVEIANLDMQGDIKLLIENHPDAIIIIAGDHGSFLTKNCSGTSEIYDISEISRLDIQDRFGTFLAIRWPTNDYENYDDIVVLQDLFPVVFAYILDDASVLASKIDPVILNTSLISGATVKNGIIYGGINDGELLFLIKE